MNFVRLLLPAAALLVFAAHFARAGVWWLALPVAALIVLLAVRRQWAARLLQGSLVLGAIEWLRTLASLAAARMALGQPWLRLALILGVVAALTLAAALVFRSRALRLRFRLG